MKMKMYQVPVTEMYAVRAQVIMEGTVQGAPQIGGGGEDKDPTEPYSAPSRKLM